MRSMTKKFIVQSIIVWSMFIITNIICIITSSKDAILSIISMLIDIFLLADSIICLKKLNNCLAILTITKEDYYNEYSRNKKEN